jgi:uncharacterized protein
MESCDTNILFYSLNRASPEHAKAKAYLQAQVASDAFSLCELVLIELYVLLRSPKLNPKPLPAEAAANLCQTFRSHPRWKLTDYPGRLMDAVWQRASAPSFGVRQIFDARLALTLRHHGVKRFATRNPKHFQGYGLEVFNPIDED